MNTIKPQELKPNELKIGNTLFFPFIGKNVNIIGKNAVETTKGIEHKLSVKEGEYFYYEPLSVFKPIELTEEILLRCGFEQTVWNSSVRQLYKEVSKNTYLSFYFGELIAYPDRLERIVIGSGPHTSGSTYRIKNIEYLHQLQNLFYSLTGEELILKNHA